MSTIQTARGLEAGEGSLLLRPEDNVDPITFSVILNRFNTIAREMTLTLEHTSWTSILALARDFSCAIYDAGARQVCMMDALPIHTNSLHVILNSMVRAFEGKVYDGDVIVSNHPYSGNTHVGDFVTACPVFYRGEHLFWAVTKGHQLDCGAYEATSVAPSAKDVWQEALQIPPIKFYEKGEPRQDVINLYLANVRYRDMLYGDLMAQLGSIWNGRRRMLELVAEYGPDELMRYVEAILDYADRRTSEQLRSIPDGSYVGEAWIDSDGMGNTNLTVKATVNVKDDHVHVDFTGSSPQGKGGTNGTQGVMEASAGIPILCAIDPDIPHNDGCLRHISCEAPEGSIVKAKYPAATAMATLCPAAQEQEAVWKALAIAAPERTSAGYAGFHCVPSISGVDERGEEPAGWAAMFFNGGSGGGASMNADGWPLIMLSSGLGGLKILSTEMCELLYPFMLDYQEIEPDSMGHGRTMGGAGIRIRVRPYGTPMDCHVTGDGAANPPFGVFGGTPGIGGGNYRENLTTGHRDYCSSKGYMKIEPGEAWVGVSSGGGGFGDPLERPARKVCEHVRDGIIRLETARDVYGVVMEPHTFALDEKATQALRATLAAGTRELPIIQPTVPGAATWLRDNMREGDRYLLDPLP
ncbi:MAG: hydantoinase B/oxoprolinase family protein [Gammaproteobacteria bacterium]|nr:hydantoinase B/oxoprolinase family protein [Gammaproteobacteria bacterium]MBI5614797.1 hydantoinase B/oxoprolinase family protein [Gammaproteobacteria bacterium]